MARSKQILLLKNEPSSYGGELLKTRKGRSRGRPLDTKHTMHLVLRSTQAKGEWSFLKPKNAAKLKGIVQKFTQKYGIKILSMANVGNHLHFQLKLTNRHSYRPFIRGMTAAIAMAITGVSRWSPNKLTKKFWDYRPFTRVVTSLKAYLTLKDYIKINEYEGYGYNRALARFFIAHPHSLPSNSS